MRTIILSLFLAISAFAVAGEVAPTDTTIIVDGKKIVIKENGEKIKVKIYEKTNKGDTIADEQTFEGVYRNGQSTEWRIGNSINIPIPRLSSGRSNGNYITDPHWGGFGIGFNNFADSHFNVNNINGVDLESGSSKKYMLNFYEKAWNISKRGWAVVSGAGFEFNTYHLSGNTAIREIDGVSTVVPAEDGITYNTSRLHTTYFTVPLLLEYQHRLHHTGPLFLSAGMVFKGKICSSSKVWYDENNDERKQKLGSDLNIKPVTMDFLVQAGVGCFGLYTSYSPFSQFERSKGPNIHPISFGLILHADL